MPSHSRTSAAPCAPHTHAVAQDVVGRRTPIAARSRPDSALNVEDLPEPVAPARATIVWSADSRSRAIARCATASARSTSGSGTRPRAAALARASPETRSSRSEETEAPKTFRAPSRSPVTTARPLADTTDSQRLLGIAQVVDATGERTDLLAGGGRRRDLGERGEVATPLRVQEYGDAAPQVLAGPIGQPANGLVKIGRASCRKEGEGAV